MNQMTPPPKIDISSVRRRLVTIALHPCGSWLRKSNSWSGAWKVALTVPAPAEGSVTVAFTRPDSAAARPAGIVPEEMPSVASAPTLTV